MIRNFIVGAFEAFAWFFFVAIIAYATWYGWHAAVLGELHMGGVSAQPWQGAIGGFVAGCLTAVVGTGLIFTLLDIRAGTDRLVELVEEELRRRRGED
ncbi:hypothetical protein sos41_36290 [Alphaproteobacteria bacterium SO-S41]|nr:hypothetical protein sos41_36290 [Alphaproteobacteria bacterium SO-S41]